MDKKQTAVQWLFEQLCSEKLSWSKDCNGKLFIDVVTSDILQKAKDMEREQIVDAYTANSVIRIRTKAEQYVNETYGGQDER